MVGSPSSNGNAQGFPAKEPRANPLPCSSPPPLPVQSQADAADEEDTSSMQELVQAIDTHMETDDLEVTSNPNTTEDVQMQQPPTKDVPDQPVGDAVHAPPTNPSI